ncbi:IS982 family transposase [Dyadobacter chenwenxiniae]|uniref:IS982 family transposase n=1 Tax=Dyadobacter chenwenxiniae TaxID=2906456 RepID=A0A9X1PRT8_9BACT|nr:IS982 family transposase [Dyadobacter chenwenxiniae]UON84075.1 IS982 family transposase [Dyadobacter chenwenxiniae]
MIHRTNYNRRRRGLSERTAQLSKLVCLKFSGSDGEYIIDSIPVPICQKPRIARLKICRDDDLVMPSTAWHASHKSCYHGFKMHLVISKSGFPFAAGMTTASMHDSQYIPFLKYDNLPECELLADRGYISADQQLALFQQVGVKIITPLKANMKIQNLWNYQRRKTRKTIETLFSQLCDQQLIKRNYAKASDGLFARIVAKIASVSILKAINSLANKPLGRIKHALLC